MHGLAQAGFLLFFQQMQSKAKNNTKQLLPVVVWVFVYYYLLFEKFNFFLFFAMLGVFSWELGEQNI